MKPSTPAMFSPILKKGKQGYAARIKTTNLHVSTTPSPPPPVCTMNINWFIRYFLRDGFFWYN